MIEKIQKIGEQVQKIAAIVDYVGKCLTNIPSFEKIKRSDTGSDKSV